MNLVTMKDREGDLIAFPLQNLVSIEECQETNTSNIFIVWRNDPITVDGLLDVVMAKLAMQFMEDKEVGFESDMEGK